MKFEDKIIGSFERISFPEFGIKRVIAKIDTGAYSGALHASGMKERVNSKGETYLIFHPLGRLNVKARTKNYVKKRVRSSNGHLEERYLVKTKVLINGNSFIIDISLSDRSTMMKGVLIGRKFLRRYHFLVDVRQGTKYRYAVKD